MDIISASTICYVEQGPLNGAELSDGEDSAVLQGTKGRSCLGSDCIVCPNKGTCPFCLGHFLLPAVPHQPFSGIDEKHNGAAFRHRTTGKLDGEIAGGAGGVLFVAAVLRAREIRRKSEGSPFQPQKRKTKSRHKADNFPGRYSLA